MTTAKRAFKRKGSFALQGQIAKAKAYERADAQAFPALRDTLVAIETAVLKIKDKARDADPEIFEAVILIGARIDAVRKHMRVQETRDDG